MSVVRVPSVDEVRALAAAAGCERQRAFILTAAWSGLRLGEIGKLDVTDLRGNKIHVKVGKGGKPRRSVLFEPGLTALQAVLPEHGSIFTTSTGYRWERRFVNKWWQAVKADAGVECRFHDLRHAHATWLLDRGVPVMDVAIQLGHFRKDGKPHTFYVETVYGHPDIGAALDRVAAVA